MENSGSGAAGSSTVGAESSGPASMNVNFAPTPPSETRPQHPNVPSSDEQVLDEYEAGESAVGETPTGHLADAKSSKCAEAIDSQDLLCRVQVDGKLGTGRTHVTEQP